MSAELVTSAKLLQLDDEETTKLTDADVANAKHEITRQNEFELIETETRNVLLLGKTRSGKSTAVSVLKDPCYEPKDFSLFSETVEAKFQSFSIKDNQMRDEITGPVIKKYTINVIDTPGLFEVKAIGDTMETRTNDSIISTISKCLENEITKLNCVMMFASFDAGVDENDVESIKIFAKLFGKRSIPASSSSSSAAAAASVSAVPSKSETGLRIALCITRSDKHDAKWCKGIAEQVMRHPQLAPIIKENDIKILFMGCIEPLGGGFYNFDHLFKGYSRIYFLRKNVLEFIINSPDQVKLLELDLMQSKKQEIAGVIDVLMQGFKFFKTVKDLNDKEVQNRIEYHKGRAKVLSTCNGFTNAAELVLKMAQLVAAAKDFLETSPLPQRTKDELVWPLVLPKSDV